MKQTFLKILIEGISVKSTLNFKKCRAEQALKSGSFILINLKVVLDLQNLYMCIV